MPRTRDPAWLAEVRAPGPNGVTFFVIPHEGLLRAMTAVGNGLMEDDVSPSLFTPGCTAYAGYDTGTFANMTAVRAYAASQNARSFSYTGNPGDGNADALDIEPGLASPSQGPAFWSAKGGSNVHLYCSAGTSSTVISYMQGAGHARSAWKLISAHYTGSHICGPGTCGYPQADATQFTDSYLGRSLDATLLGAGFFAATAPPPPLPSFPLQPGSSGAVVSSLQADLNRWASAIGLKVPLTADGAFGPLTAAAVKLAQAYLRQAVTGTVSQALYTELQGPVTAVSWAGMSATPYLAASFSWPAQGAVTDYSLDTRNAAGVITPHPVTGTHVPGLIVGRPGSYTWRVVPKGGAASPWKSVSG